MTTLDEHLQRTKEEHIRGEHFSWSNCPWCWAERKIKEYFDEVRRIV